MNILIIGTGNMGRGIATRALAGKNTVTLHDEDGSKAQALGLLGITLQFRLNTGFGTAWKLVLPTA